MSTITREEIIKLGRMSQIELTEQEIELLLTDLQAVLDYASGLNKIAQPYKTTVSLDTFSDTNRMREDQIISTNSEPLLAQAPEREDRFFVVPQVIKQEREK